MPLRSSARASTAVRPRQAATAWQTGETATVGGSQRDATRQKRYTARTRWRQANQITVDALLLLAFPFSCRMAQERYAEHAFAGWHACCRCARITPLSSILSEVDKTTMIHTIRIELTVEVAGEWPGNDAACDAALAHVSSGVIDVGDHGALLIQSMTAEILGCLGRRLECNQSAELIQPLEYAFDQGTR